MKLLHLVLLAVFTPAGTIMPGSQAAGCNRKLLQLDSANTTTATANQLNGTLAGFALNFTLTGSRSIGPFESLPPAPEILPSLLSTIGAGDSTELGNVTGSYLGNRTAVSRATNATGATVNRIRNATSNAVSTTRNVTTGAIDRLDNSTAGVVSHAVNKTQQAVLTAVDPLPPDVARLPGIELTSTPSSSELPGLSNAVTGGTHRLLLQDDHGLAADKPAVPGVQSTDLNVSISGNSLLGLSNAGSSSARRPLLQDDGHLTADSAAVFRTAPTAGFARASEPAAVMPNRSAPAPATASLMPETEPTETPLGSITATGVELPPVVEATTAPIDVVAGTALPDAGTALSRPSIGSNNSTSSTGNSTRRRVLQQGSFQSQFSVPVVVRTVPAVASSPKPTTHYRAVPAQPPAASLSNVTAMGNTSANFSNLADLGSEVAGSPGDDYTAATATGTAEAIQFGNASVVSEPADGAALAHNATPAAGGTPAAKADSLPESDTLAASDTDVQSAGATSNETLAGDQQPPSTGGSASSDAPSDAGQATNNTARGVAGLPPALELHNASAPASAAGQPAVSSSSTVALPNLLPAANATSTVASGSNNTTVNA